MKTTNLTLDRIFNEEDSKNLYQIQMDLNHDISSLHKEISLSQNSMDKIRLKEQLNSNYTLLDACKDKLHKVKLGFKKFYGGSPHKITVQASIEQKRSKRGRPKGSKNKVKKSK